MRRSDLVRFLVQQYGHQSLTEIVRREVAIDQINQMNIEISAEHIEKEARKILEKKNISLTEYLSSRGIDRTTWVNEVLIFLGMEELCRQYIVRLGGLNIRYVRYLSEEEAHKTGVPTEQSSEWIASFMVENETVSDILFSEKPPKIFYDGIYYWAIDIVDRVPSTRLTSALYEENFEKLAMWRPSKVRLEQFLDYLVSLQDVEYLKDRLYHELK